jgi:hypothetical protein
LSVLESLAVGTPVVACSTTGALRALAVEFPSPNVTLVDDLRPSVVRHAVEAARTFCVDVEIPSWEQIASTCLTDLNESGGDRVAA